VSQALPYNETFVIAAALMVLLLPLLSFILSILTPQRYSWLIGINSPLLMLTSTVFSFILLFSFWNHEPYILKIEWFSAGVNSIRADIMLSNESILMLSVVALISFLVHVYSIAYMAGDTHVRKYFAMLGFFTFAMQGIVLADNLLLLFVFWELVGFSSYILIGHWHERPAAARAATKAFLMNRIGDAGFLVGLLIIWTNTGSLNLNEIVVHGSIADWQTFASLCIFCGVIGKSAQFPLFTWLPDAMEGPTPVSALIHAATMVTAGVYLLIRTFPLFTDTSLQVIAFTGLITGILAALCAVFQNDLKKILAYSTISHLGIMMIAIGIGSPAGALLHLLTHAFFKACLFLSAGSVIYAVHLAQHQSSVGFDVQDIRNLGGLKNKIPFTYYCFLISGASLAGVPFFSGFLSKDAILSAAWANQSSLSSLMLVGLLAIFFLSAVYMVRMITMTFWGESKIHSLLQVNESPFVMRAPMIVLAFLSFWFVVSWNPFNFSGWLLANTNISHSWIVVSISVLILISGATVGYWMFHNGKNKTAQLFTHDFYVDWFYEKTVVRITHSFSSLTDYMDRRVIDRVIHGAAYAQVTIAHVFGWIDRAFIDGMVNGLGRLARIIGSITRSFQGGNIQLYIFWSLFAIIIFLIWTIN
jgi:NADH-quinone oxidoreductase subunit L